MKFEQILDEATYGKEPQEIAKKIFENVFDKIKSGKKFYFDISPYFPNSPKSVNFFYAKNNGRDANAEVISNKFSYDLMFYRDFQKEMSTNRNNLELIKESFLQTIEHEIIHIMDFIRSNGKFRRSKIINKYGTIERYHKEYNSGGSKGMRAYYTHELEFNRLLNQLVEWIKDNQAGVDRKIKNRKDLIKLIKIFDDKSETGRAFDKDEELYRALILRLNREGVLPKDFK